MEQHDEILNQIAEGIARRGLIVPARIALDAITPLGFLASQMALFAQPLVPSQRWRAYVAALTDEAGWSRLHHLIVERES